MLQLVLLRMAVLIVLSFVFFLSSTQAFTLLLFQMMSETDGSVVIDLLHIFWSWGGTLIIFCGVKGSTACKHTRGPFSKVHKVHNSEFHHSVHILV